MRYVLYGKKPLLADVAFIKTHPDLKVIDNTDDRAFLVEATSDTMDSIRSQLGSWVIAEERFYDPA